MTTTPFAPPAAPPVPRPVAGHGRPPATPAWWRPASALAAVASVLVVVGLWLVDGGFGAVTGSGGVLVALSRLAGLVASDLLLLQVLLMARLPFVERSWGQGELARVHRVVGFTSFTLLVVHIGSVVGGYGLLYRNSWLAQAWHITWSYPGMLLAAAGTALLVMIVVTSVRAARSRLRYSSWHLLHLYAYAGAGLALPHQLWAGGDFVANPVARVYWWALWLAALGSVLVYRIGLPLARSWRHVLVVEEVVPEGPGVVSVHLRGRRLDELGAQGGQFLQWRFLDGAGVLRAHPYSLSAAPRGDRLRITVKDHGSGRVAALRPGTRALVEGPYGRLTAERRTRRQVLLMAGGIGITPLRALLDELDAAPGEVTVLYRAGSQDDLVLLGELESFVRRRGVRVVRLVGPRPVGRDSWLPASAAHLSDVEALRHLVPDVAAHDVYLCGAPGWMASAQTALLAAGVPPEHLHAERFAW